MSHFGSYIRKRRCEWDTAAAHAVVKFAGKKVLKLDGRELEYNKENLLNPYFVVK
ncbi:hypothetical protein GF336_01900 [Candidatus Woesearchaeota archaeon]|nr:hypothetical protein [Candidatus Woesearchaeota archaeon]